MLIGPVVASNDNHLPEKECIAKSKYHLFFHLPKNVYPRQLTSFIIHHFILILQTLRNNPKNIYLPFKSPRQLPALLVVSVHRPTFSFDASPSLEQPCGALLLS
jgi:hypothetical protein